MQDINTKNHGKITFIRTWVDGNIHIGKTADGSYRHIGGPQVVNINDLNVIPNGPDRAEAEEWFEETFVRKPAREKQAAIEKARVVVKQADEPVDETFHAKIVKKVEAAKTQKASDKKVCPICKKEVSSAAALYGHMRTHKNEVPATVDADIIDPDEPRETVIDD